MTEERKRSRWMPYLKDILRGTPGRYVDNQKLLKDIEENLSSASQERLFRILQQKKTELSSAKNSRGRIRGIPFI